MRTSKVRFNGSKNLMLTRLCGPKYRRAIMQAIKKSPHKKKQRELVGAEIRYLHTRALAQTFHKLHCQTLTGLRHLTSAKLIPASIRPRERVTSKICSKQFPLTSSESQAGVGSSEFMKLDLKPCPPANSCIDEATIKTGSPPDEVEARPWSSSAHNSEFRALANLQDRCHSALCTNSKPCLPLR